MKPRIFTPWLTDNPDFFGEALGMDPRLEATEAVVGQYKADLVYVEDYNGKARCRRKPLP